MKIGILSRKSDLYSTQRLLEAAKNRGHEAHIINTLRCYMNISPDDLSIHYKGALLTGFDAIIPRIGASITSYGTAVVRQFEMMGVFSVNEAIAIQRSRDKLRALQLLSKKGIGMPTTGVAHSPEDIGDLIKMVGGYPLVIKLLEGTQGIGVVLAETKSAAESVIEAFLGLKVNMLAQEYIKEASGADIRCFVIGDQVIAAMKRQAKPGEFRSNLHRGGFASLEDITPTERNIAIQASKVMGLNIAGVDLIRSKRGPLVVEVNSSPGLKGIEDSSGQDIAGLVIEFIEKHVRSSFRTHGMT